MQNKNKHSIKCNKRDKVSPISVEYQVFYCFHFREQYISSYSSKLLALQVISLADNPSNYIIKKVTVEKVLS